MSRRVGKRERIKRRMKKFKEEWKKKKIIVKRGKKRVKEKLRK